MAKLPLYCQDESVEGYWKWAYWCLRYPYARGTESDAMTRRIAFLTLYLRTPWKAWRYTANNDDMEYSRGIVSLSFRACRDRPITPKPSAEDIARFMANRSPA